MATQITETRNNADMDGLANNSPDAEKTFPRLETMPYLSRTRQMDVSRLDAEPQKDLRTIHSILLRGITDVDNKLRLLEQSFYGPGRTAVDELSRWGLAVRPMLPVAGVTAFLSAEQVNNATRRRDVDADGLELLHATIAKSKTANKKTEKLMSRSSTMSEAPDGEVATADAAAVSGQVDGDHEKHVETLPEDNSQENKESEENDQRVNTEDEQPTTDAAVEDHQIADDDNVDNDPDSADTKTTEQGGVQQQTSSLTKSSEASAAADTKTPAPSRIKNANKTKDDDDDDDDQDDVLFTLSRTLRDCLRKTLDAVPDKFDDVTSDVRRLQRHLRKYCISFYEDQTDSGVPPPVVLDTAATYESQIRRRTAIIDESTASIRDLAEQFRKSELRVADFGAFGADLARRTGCAHAPFLLLFPAAAERVRIVLATMRDWVADDADYADFIGNDVADLERRLKTYDRRLVTSRQAFHQLAFRARQTAATCDQLRIDLGKTQGREDQLTVDEEMLATETAELRAEAETTEYRLSEISRNAARYTAEAHYEKLNELSEQLREIRARLPVADQALTGIRQKLAQLLEKRDQLKTESKLLASLELQRDDIASKMAEQEVERDACTMALETARRILLCKRSSDAVRKIFYDRPAHLSNSQRLPGVHHSGGQGDDFEQTCRIVAARIDRDWQALYRLLPFHPPRGTSTVDHDVAEIDNARDPPSVSAGRALARWRRHHTMACIDDLTEALKQIGRADVLRRLAAVVCPPPPPVVTLSEVPDWVQPELIPYWREVERFDQLRAARHHKH